MILTGWKVEEASGYEGDTSCVTEEQQDEDVMQQQPAVIAKSNNNQYIMF